jgi:hypothetical protein
MPNYKQLLRDHYLLTMLAEGYANVERIGQHILEAQKGLSNWSTVTNERTP